MVAQTRTKNSDDCSLIAVFDPSIEPGYNDNDGIATWGFTYSNGPNMSYCHNQYDNNKTWACTFRCDPSKEHSLSEVMDDGCIYSVIINTRYACSSYTTTTTTTTTSEPDPECIFKSGNGNILNLSPIKGDIISHIDNKTNHGYYYYTPCENIAPCDGLPSMAYIFNAQIGSCEQCLAVWENGIVQPQYISELGMWQFTYTNGEDCGRHNTSSIFQVQWFCDETAVSPKVVQAQEITECVYQMIINSSLACS